MSRVSRRIRKVSLSQATSSWSWGEDRQWSHSWFSKRWHGESLHWEMEVRSEQRGAGTRRLGEIQLNGSHNGTLTLALKETDWDTRGD